MAKKDKIEEVEIIEATEEVKKDKKTAKVTGGYPLNVRADTYIGAPVLRTLKEGSKVEVVEDLGTWCAIEGGGFVMRQYLSF